MLAYLIFSATMIAIYARPFGFGVWVYSSLGAFLALVCGVVSPKDVWRVWAMVWDSTLVLVGLIILSLALEKLLFFDYLAFKILCLAGARDSQKRATFHCKRARLFVLLGIFSAFVASFLANDGAILVLTPLVFALFSSQISSQIRPVKNCQNPVQNALPPPSPLVIFLLIVGFLSDFASNIFVISNLTNILTAELFGIDFLDFTRLMLLPQIFAILSSLLIFWLFLGRKLPRIITLTSHFREDSLSPFGVIFCVLLLATLPLFSAFGAIFSLPLCIFVFFNAALALVYGIKTRRICPLNLLKDSPFSVVVFSVGLFVVVFGLKNAGLLEILQKNLALIANLGENLSLFVVGFLSAFGSSFINNLPMVMLGDLALREAGDSGLVFAHLLGTNIGAKFTPIGSLATLLWLFNLKRRGVEIPIFRYLFLAFCFSFVVLAAALAGLCVALSL